jgi:signal transduction histidine kinase
MPKRANTKISAQINKDNQIKIKELLSISRQLLEQHEIILNNIGRELHDETGQTLTVIKLMLEKIKNNEPQKTNDEINHIIQQVSLLINEVSNLSIDLNPPIARGLDLISALNGLLERMQKLYHLNANVKYMGLFDNISFLLRIAVYRFIQEILKEIIDSSDVKNTSIIIKSSNDTIDVNIIIRGINIHPFETSNNQKLTDIQDTIQLLNGKLSIKSLKNDGTNIILIFPIFG